ncbi:hypothetical protein ACS0TY_017000 [Phlomoides rotata]
MDEFRKTLLLIISLLIPAISADTINSSQIIRDGETLVSSGGVFELGFFSLGNSSNRYVGIWYKDIPIRTYVWVANRQAPLTTNSGVLRVTEPGILAVFSGINDTVPVWSTNSTRSVGNPAAQLLDSGNLVVKEDKIETLVWQSFDYPTDTFLPGIGMGWNYVTGVETYVSSWRSEDDPAPGEYSIHTDPTGYPQLIIRKGNVVQTRLGPWNGLRWSGAPDTSTDPTYQVRLLMNDDEVKYTEIYTPSIISRIRLIPRGTGQRSTWSSRTSTWATYFTMPVDNCDNYRICGAHGSCTVGNSPNCACLEMFVPRDPESWNRAEWSSGCIRRTPLNCPDDVFLKYSGVRLPDSTNSTFDDQILLLGDCEVECKRNCSCVAYTQLNISGSGSGCLFYHGELSDIRTIAQAGQDLYIRMASSESPPNSNVGSSKNRTRVKIIASLTSVAGMIVVCLIVVLILIRKRKKEPSLGTEVAVPFSGRHVVKDADLPFFSLSAIMQATNNFSSNNKLGEGGFGPVYKGMLEDGQQIAVKRLSKTSSQGVDELKNEVILIAKLQHRNLVRTLGCCAEGEENMLIYEYMPNSSLDLILFDETKSMLLDWQKRFHIINGIAKGLLYLHQDSRLRIIHRDLKTSNILLDADMNPKISDFGLARSFGGNQTEDKTRRVVGTYGYMSPEYAIDGLFSIKSDVFSFGVLVLEIVSGKRNRGFSLNEHYLNLLGHAWTLYTEGIACDLVDPCLGETFDLSQVMQSIHVGLLCVQKSPEDRPNMSSVVFMLGNDVALPQAKQPGFFTERDVLTDKVYSRNQVTITWMQGR